MTGNESIHWFPLRIFHSNRKRLEALKASLDGEDGIETYVPEKLIDADAQTYEPVLVNYIFVRTTLDRLRDLKRDDKRFVNLRYVMSVQRNDSFQQVSTIGFVSDREMANFRKVVDKRNEQVLVLRNKQFAVRPGQKVRIIDGAFEGVVGTVKTIKKHLCVIVTLGDVMAIAITGVHKKHIMPIDTDDV